MSDFIQKLEIQVHRLGSIFHEKYDILPEVLFMSNNIYWDLYRACEEHRNVNPDAVARLKKGSYYKSFLGLNIRILDASEGDSEFYVGIIEE